MKTFKKIFIGALVLLFGPWVNMQAQYLAAVEGNTMTKTVKNKTSKSLKQKRAAEFIAEHPGVIQLAGGGTVNFELSGDCSRKSCTAKASQIMLTFPLEESFPLEKLGDFIHKKEAIYNGIEKEYDYLKHDQPGEGQEKYDMRQEALKKLREQLIFHRDQIRSARNVLSKIENILDTFIVYVTEGLTIIS